MHSVYLFQPNYQGGKGQFVSQWLPYSIATLWAYVEQFEEIKNNFRVEECIFMREEIDIIIDRIVNPDLCLFSNYIWNENYNLLLAKAIRKKWPKCLIVFGGPQVDEVGFNFISRNSFINSIVVNEGEISLHRLLLDLLETGKIKKIYDKEKRIELENLPSPYVDSDIMDNIIKRYPNVKWATTIETNRGCPFACTFCDWGSLTQSKIKKFNLEKVFQEIDWIGKNKIEYVYLADANFGVFYERDREIAEYLAQTKIKTGYPLTLNATYYKNSAVKTIEIAEIVHKVGLNRGLTLSVQSMSDKVLTAIERQNMEASQLVVMYKECEKRNVQYYTEIILGLPLETKESWKEGLCTAAEAGCHILLEVYPLEILRNSELAKQIDQHGLDIKNFETVMSGQPSSISEKHNYVIGTKYMSREDYIDCWMWTWLMNNFHNYGWTQILSKFGFRQGVRYKNFYEDFYVNCVLNDNFLKQLHDQQRDELVDFFWNDNINSTFRDDNIIMYTRQSVLHQNREHIKSIISNWAIDYFKDVDQHLLQQVIDFNFDYVTNIKNKDTRRHTYMFNLHEYCNNIDELLQEEYSYEFSNALEWTSDADFYEKLHYRHRNGFATQKIKRKK
jgi:putative methyltransferase